MQKASQYEGFKNGSISPIWARFSTNI
jgi:hypothetical protein